MPGVVREGVIFWTSLEAPFWRFCSVVFDTQERPCVQCSFSVQQGCGKALYIVGLLVNSKLSKGPDTNEQTNKQTNNIISIP